MDSDRVVRCPYGIRNFFPFTVLKTNSTNMLLLLFTN